MTFTEWLRIIIAAALTLLIAVSLIWWVYALAHGVFALGPFLSLMAGIIIAGVLSDKEQR